MPATGPLVAILLLLAAALVAWRIRHPLADLAAIEADGIYGDMGGYLAHMRTQEAPR